MAELPENVLYQSVAYGTEESELDLPDTLTILVNEADENDEESHVLPYASFSDATMSDASASDWEGGWMEVPVRWSVNMGISCGAEYDGEQPGTYVYDVEFVNHRFAAGEAILPSIEVTVMEEDVLETEELVLGATVGDVRITLNAKAGVFPEDVRMEAELVDANGAEQIVTRVEEGAAQEGQERDILSSWIFDIRVLDTDGEEVQPDLTVGVPEITFELNEEAAEDGILQVFHLESAEDTAEAVSGLTRGESVTAQAEHFSYYVLTVSTSLRTGTGTGVAEIVESGNTYDTLAEAIEEAEDGDTVILLDNVYLTNALVIDDSKNVILDLGGHSLACNMKSGTAAIRVRGSLTLQNSVDGAGTLSEDKASRVVSVDGGIFTLDGATISADRTYGVYVDGDGSFVMDGGTITGTKNGVYLSKGSAVMSDGEISGCYEAVKMIAKCSFEMSGGTLSSCSFYAVEVAGDATFTMTDGEIRDCSGTGVYVFENGAFTMESGQISNNSYGVSNSGAFVMKDGVISGNAGTGVTSSRKGTFTMSGGKISGNTGTGVNAYKFEMSGGEISGNTGSSGVSVYDSFTLVDGTISRNSGYGVYLSSAEFTMNDGTISNNGGYGIYLLSASFTMNDGTISDNDRYGVYAYKESTFQMLGGTISKNINGGVYCNNSTISMQDGIISENSGTGSGGVYITGSSAAFTMEGGTISKNSGINYAGGVSVLGGNFTMTGGEISGNTTTRGGGGVYVYPTRDSSAIVFQMTGGTISGNTATEHGGGVYVSTINSNLADFRVSGAPVIQGNTANGTEENVYLCTGNTITLTGALADGAQIGVSAADKPSKDVAVPVTYEDGTSYYGDAAGYFSSDNEAFRIRENTTDGCIELYVLDITLDSLNQSCMYDGTAKEFSTVNDQGVTSGFTVKYYVNGEWTTSAPVSAGTYDVKVTRDSGSGYLAVGVTGTLTILPAAMEGVTVSGYSGTYDGNGHGITVTLGEDAGDALVSYSTDGGQTWSAENPTYVNAGEYSVICQVTRENYTDFTGEAKIVIDKAEYDMSGVSFASETYVYDKTEKTLTITGTLPEGVSVSYENNTRTEAGSQTATAKFMGDENHETPGSLTAELTIRVREIPVPELPENVSFDYTGENHTLGIAADEFYTIEGNVQSEAGTYEVVISLSDAENTVWADGTSEDRSVTFTIKAADLTEDRFTVDTEAETYTGEAITKAIDSSLVEGEDYTVSYSDNMMIGMATVTVTGIGNYSGTLTFSFEIVSGPESETKDENNPDDDSSDDDSTASGRWSWDGNGWTYINASGTQVRGGSYIAESGETFEKLSWCNIGGRWWAFGSDGYLKDGWIYENETARWYYVDGSSGMQTGWYRDSQDGCWYYLNRTDGHMLTGWQYIDGKWYCFNAAPTGQTWYYDLASDSWNYDETTAHRPYGAMFQNEQTPDGHDVGEDGAWETGNQRQEHF